MRDLDYCIRLSGLLLALCCPLSAVSADPLWVRTYGNPYGGFDEVHAIGADDSGNVVVSGFSELSSSDAEFVTIKYKPNGDTAWLRHFNPGNGQDGATALAIDRSGNVIVTGYTGDASSSYGPWTTIKYSPAGESLWATTWEYGVYCLASDIVVDSAGNIYMTGRAGSLNYLDFAVVKYHPSGDTAWQFVYDSGNDDYSNAVAVDRAGNVYATGSTVSGGMYGDVLTVKLNAAGESLWRNIWAGPGGRWDAARFIAVDSSGNVFVAGVSDDTTGRGDFLTMKYNPSGDTLWTRLYKGAGNQSDQVMGLALDAAGNAYVTGGSYASSYQYDYTTIKYAPDGTQRWVAHYPGASHRAYPEAIALDADANVYVAGYSYDSTGASDVVTVKYDSAGNQRWVERHDGPNGEAEAYVMALGPDSSVFVGGRANSDSGGMDYLALRYGVAGAVAEKGMTPDASRPTPAATIVRSIMLLPASGELLDISGRKVLDLHPGANDVRRLAPGVYFVHEGTARTAAKVVLQR